MLYFFGYVKSSTDPADNFTGFFEYDAATDAEQAVNYNGHKQLTNQVIEWTATMTPTMLEEFQYQVSDKSKEVNILNSNTTANSGKAINDWSEIQLYGKSYTNCK